MCERDNGTEGKGSFGITLLVINSDYFVCVINWD